MPTARSIHRACRVLVLWMMSAGCGHTGATGSVRPPVGPGAVEQAAVPDAAAEPGEARVASQQVNFAEDDLGAGPATQVRVAPKRPPMPRFKLFGTREGDGP